MSNACRVLASLLLVCAVPDVLGQGTARPCTVAPFSGASTGRGAVANVQMHNTGATCQFANFGVPETKSNPATSGTILVGPRNGTAAFKAPDVLYTPRPGFVGEDEFEYEAHALSRSSKPMRLLVKVRVVVQAAK